MKNKSIVFGGVVVVILVIGLTLMSLGKDQGNQQTELVGPVDVTLDFFEPWLKAINSSSTDPFTSNLHNSPVLSQQLRDRLNTMQNDGTFSEVDPVLCQSVIPKNIEAKILFEQDAEAKVLVLSRSIKLPGQAVVTLQLKDNAWIIDDILCSTGESAPESEFSFEREGYLLKDVKPPLDPQYWHLVYEENGLKGHVAPLFFDEQSTCIATDLSEALCQPEQLIETDHVFLQGEITEAGVEVRRMKSLE